ncbi:hypothetical protein ABUS55_01395, partial [Citrobacter pasteurii]|uniref:hypothetical protein n=1 Tax=Citrobacter pasteurii TaxID=1563222 RepID=UPI00352E0297
PTLQQSGITFIPTGIKLPVLNAAQCRKNDLYLHTTKYNRFFIDTVKTATSFSFDLFLRTRSAINLI